MESLSGSALLPSSVTTWPFTATRPAVMRSSAARREVMPAWASIFCNLSSTVTPIQRRRAVPTALEKRPQTHPVFTPLLHKPRHLAELLVPLLHQLVCRDIPEL